MIKKLLIVLSLTALTTFGFSEDILIDTKDKAQVKQIEQEIIKEKFDEAQKELKEQEERALEEQKSKEINMQNLALINDLLLKIEKMDASLKDNILLKRYSNYLSYRKISTELNSLNKSIAKKKNADEEQIYQLHNKIRVKENELELIAEYKGSPIGGFINPPEIEKPEQITNPFGIINALSQIKKLEDNKKIFNNLEKDISDLTIKLADELFVYLELFNLEQKSDYKERITFLDKQKKDFNMVLEIVSTTEEVYTRKIEQVILEIKNQISQQIQKSLVIFIIIVVLSFFAFLVKLALKKYFSQNESYYMTNKIINFTVVFLIVMVLMFSYIDNVSYLSYYSWICICGYCYCFKRLVYVYFWLDGYCNIWFYSSWR